MFWIFMLFVGFALTLVILGVFSVWVTILSWALKISLLIIICLTVTVLWRKVFGTTK